MKKFRFIPFDILNLFLKLTGEDKEIAKIKYYYDGEEKKEKIKEIVNGNKIPKIKKKLDADKKAGIISDIEYEKLLATAEDKPWVKIINMTYGGENLSQGYFELDWNDQFIQELKDNGYLGNTDEMLVRKWLDEICKNIALDSLNEEQPLNESPNTIKFKSIQHGRSEYS